MKISNTWRIFMSRKSDFIALIRKIFEYSQIFSLFNHLTSNETNIKTLQDRLVKSLLNLKTIKSKKILNQSILYIETDSVHLS